MATTNNITLNQLKDLFKDFQTRHYQLNDYYFGDITGYGNDNAYNYPVLGVVPQSSTLVKGNSGLYNNIQHTFNVFVADLIRSGEENQIDVLSDTQQILIDLIAEMNNDPYFNSNNINIITDAVLTPFFERFEDLVGGWNISITLSMPNKARYCKAPMDAKTNTTIIGNC